MNESERTLFEEFQNQGINLGGEPTWENCRKWLWEREWRINVLSDYPRDEVKFTVRRGFERIEFMGRSDLEVMAKAILEVNRRQAANPED